MDQKFIINLQGKDHALYAGVLAEAHERGLQSISVELLQIPSEANEHVAIARATVVMKDGSVFSEIGDASPRNTRGAILTALIRMSATRAKGRALRDAVNVGQALVEELGDLSDASDDSPSAQRPALSSPAPRAARAVANAERETVSARVDRPSPPPPPKWKAPDGGMYSRSDLAGSLLIRQTRARERGIDWHEFDVDAADEAQIWEELTALVAAIQAHDSAAAA